MVIIDSGDEGTTEIAVITTPRHWNSVGFAWLWHCRIHFRDIRPACLQVRKQRVVNTIFYEGCNGRSEF
jgi:hypothetical protein